jgi:predicted house-cleaning noncanonical NTP pyrophosphatase (MazG superfamily)
MKTYNYKGLEFRLKDNDLELLKNAAPLLIKYRKLLHEYTKDIDMSEVNTYRDRMNELSTAASQLIDSDDAADKERAEELMAKLNETESEFEENTKAMSLMRLYNDCEGFVLLELIADVNFMKPFMQKILTGPVDKLNFEENDIITLIKDAVEDFFIITGKSKIISAA